MGVAGGFAGGRALAGDAEVAAVTSYAFRGEHQAGITTPAQDRLHFAALHVTTDSRDELVSLLEDWTEAAERMTRGDYAGPEVGGRGQRPAAARRHRRGDRAAGQRADDHVRVRSRPLPRR